MRAAFGLTLALLASTASAQPTEWYDPAPLITSVRPAMHADLARAAGVGSLSELPLYDLDVSIDARRGSFVVEEQIWLTNRDAAPLSEIVLRIYANAVPGPPLVTLEGAHCLDGVRCTSAIDSASAVTIRPAQPIAPGGRLRLLVNLSGRLQVIDSSRTNVLAQGLESLGSLQSGEHAGDYGLLSVGDGIVSMANFYAVLARREDDGSWVRGESSTMGDLGSDAMGHVRALVRVERGLRVVATGRVESRRLVSGRSHVRVLAGMVRDFAILASRSFASAERRVGDVVVRSWFLPQERTAGERVLDVAAESLAVFERRFGDYPYVDLDVVEAPLVGGAGGVEFAGLVTVASMFYRPMDTSGLGALAALLGGGGGGAGAGAGLFDGMLELVTAHEVAHQWWHGLVGSDSRAHPFVDESLAQWSAMLYLEERYGAARARRESDMQIASNYQMMRMMGQPDAAVDRPVDAFGDSMSYAGLVYGKGPYMYPALRQAVGDRAFFAALRQYVERYRFRQAPNRGFVDVLAQGSRARRVRAIARHWLEETHGDADLGQLDASRMLGGMTGGGLDPNDPSVQAMRQLLQGMGGSRAAPGDAESRRAAEEMMRWLESP